MDGAHSPKDFAAFKYKSESSGWQASAYQKTAFY